MLAEVLRIDGECLVLDVLDGPHKGKKAWLPKEEWLDDPCGIEEAWDILEVGQQLAVAMLSDGSGVTRRLEVTRKGIVQAEPDGTWLHQPRFMRIVSVGKTLIWGEVDGVPAFMKLEDYMRFQDRQHIKDSWVDHAALASGDILGGIVKSIRDNDVEGLVRLDPCEYLELRRREIAHDCEKTSEKKPVVAERSSDDEARVLPTETAQRISPLLLVENDEKCLESIRSLLSDAGVEVRSARTVEEIMPKVGSTRLEGQISPTSDELASFRMAVVDPNLGPANDDLEGMCLIETLACLPHCRILVITGELSSVRKLRDWGGVQVNNYLCKPFTMTRFLEAIGEALTVDRRPLKEWIAEETDQDAQGVGGSAQAEATNGPSAMPTSKLPDVLGELSSLKPGTVVHVFEIHPRSFRARSMAGVGSGFNWEPLRGKIGKSPIKDAVLSSDPIFESPRDGRRSHVWTLEMMEYESFAAIPVKVTGACRHVLVAFHRERDAFDTGFRHAAILCAERVGRLMERDGLMKLAKSKAEFADVGMSLSCLAHELSNDLTAISSSATRFAGDLRNRVMVAPADKVGLENALNEICRDIDETLGKFQLFRGRYAAREDVSVGSCLRRAAMGCRSVLDSVVSRKDRIVIERPSEEAPEEQWFVNAMPPALIIVFFNLYLNAVQQIAEASFANKSGRVWHSCVRNVDEDGRHWGTVRIHDTGPGIHPEDWGRIFEPGYTTKPKGTGLGLHICRILLGDIREGGREASIRVSRSVLWDGTTFAVRLPLIPKQ